jgi:hypothetical protein
MCLLGKRYPASYEEFMRSGLPGTFASERAGRYVDGAWGASYVADAGSTAQANAAAYPAHLGDGAGRQSASDPRRSRPVCTCLTGAWAGEQFGDVARAA